MLTFALDSKLRKGILHCKHAFWFPGKTDELADWNYSFLIATQRWGAECATKESAYNLVPSNQKLTWFFWGKLVVELFLLCKRKNKISHKKSENIRGEGERCELFKNYFSKEFQSWNRAICPLNWKCICFFLLFSLCFCVCGFFFLFFFFI